MERPMNSNKSDLYKDIVQFLNIAYQNWKLEYIICFNGWDTADEHV